MSPHTGRHTRTGNPIILTLAALGAMLAATPGARAAEPVPIGTFSDWQAFKVAGGSNGDICYALAKPKDAEPKNVRRGPIFFMVTDWPARNVKGEVSVVAGYPYKEGSQVTANVDGDKFQLFTQNDAKNEGGAWVADREQEVKLLSAMKRGNTMIVTGTSTRGTLTTDRYSLSGITAAVEAIGKACK